MRCMDINKKKLKKTLIAFSFNLIIQEQVYYDYIYTMKNNAKFSSIQCYMSGLVHTMWITVWTTSLRWYLDKKSICSKGFLTHLSPGPCVETCIFIQKPEINVFYFRVVNDTLCECVCIVDHGFFNYPSCWPCTIWLSRPYAAKRMCPSTT